MELNDVFYDIVEFHRKFGLLPEDKGLLRYHVLEFRLRFIKEECKELDDAHLDLDFVSALDACIDITYVALGTLVMMGFSEHDMREAWKRVHAANMRKVRAQDVGQSKRGSTLDVIKPDGWEPPILDDLCET